ncbi:MAG: Trm112 family protein [Gammaproteobacteria bacterium]|nr:Trm112 family protein [Gammaproteobacteria bacterium]MDH3767962.1 Trm112 family protein [Gammaproteobacteria bacterium]
MIDRDIIDILACPTSHRPLRPIPPNKLDTLNELIKSGRARYVDGEKIEQIIEAALITDNGTIIYRIDNDIPVLLVERGIAARQIDDY